MFIRDLFFLATKLAAVGNIGGNWSHVVEIVGWEILRISYAPE